MRVAAFNSPTEPFTIEQRPVPEPHIGEVLVRVGRCGICGSDLNLTSGRVCEGLEIPKGTVMGHEWCGEVVATGPGVTRLKQGDIIAGTFGAGCGECPFCVAGEAFMCRAIQPYLGGFGQYVLGHERASIALPRTLSMADGALVEPLAVSLHGVRMAGIQPHSRVLVLGAGSIGLGAIFWARKLRPRTLVAASRSSRRAEIALAMGADHFVTTHEDDAARISARLGGPPDIVIEAVGVPGMLAKSIGLVAPNGTVISLGFCTSPDSVVPALTCMKQARLLFPVVYTLAEFEQSARVLERDRLPDPSMMVSAITSLDDFPSIIDELRHEHTQTKVQLDPWA
jgi:threonine dehydrogenase-like Zn-dependent dehydrogenase